MGVVENVKFEKRLRKLEIMVEYLREVHRISLCGRNNGLSSEEKAYEKAKKTAADEGIDALFGRPNVPYRDGF